MDDQTSEIEVLEQIYSDKSAEPIKISYATIKHLTKNFAQVIGSGGFGVVYLGGLRNWMVAVKKCFISTDFSDKAFLKEVTCLSKVNHRNIVRFIGYCADTLDEVVEVEGRPRIVKVNQRLLCYEYVPNGNLHDYLKEKSYGYEWNVRYKIIMGICQGLHYIHQSRIYHLDLKPANILLGANMEPKITDFGLSRFGNEGYTTVTQNVLGTIGYIAPEFINANQLSSKSDIYSLGVIMVNLLTGTNGGVIENWHGTIDADDFPEMKRCVKIAKRCLEINPRSRPTMGEIIHYLKESETVIQKGTTIINEPRNDPRSSLYQVVLRFHNLTIHGERPRTDTLLSVKVDLPECMLEGCKEPGKLSFQLLRFITGNFSDEQKIGFGGFGNVYRGTLAWRNIAVKRRHNKKIEDIHELQFYREIKTMMLAQHKNVVRFLGYCSYTEKQVFEHEGNLVMAEVQERLLCFEYLRKGSLYRYISDASRRHEWRERYRIIKGICEGLHYIHGKRIVHLDIKLENILLDNNMAPKIADFGISRYFGENQSLIITENVIGTMGHMAPEFFNGVITFKTDIYSLGATIAQILIGQNYCSAMVNVLECWRERLKTSSVDTVFLGQIRVCTEISIACTAKEPDNRPDTRRIIEMLAKTETNEGVAVDNQDGEVAPDNLVETSYMELVVPECLLEGSEMPGNLSYPLLQFMTENFSEERKLGQDRFGSTYKGLLRERWVAVKRLWMSMDFDDTIFHNEVNTLILARHRNIVQFLGYCSSTEQEAVEYQGEVVMADMHERLLCFEYLSNGRLDHYVSDASCGLGWRTRYQIIRGICEGLHYLHQEHIIHLDLNPGSILLDDNMIPKIDVFGLSRSLGENESWTTATMSFRKPGYMPPEFQVDSRVITFKTNIYSLGVTITKILIGQKHYSTIENVLESWNKRSSHISSTDTVLLDQVRVCAEISRACIADDPDKRPHTGRIIEMLDEIETNGAAPLSNEVDFNSVMEVDVLERIVKGNKKPGILSYQLLLFITGNFSDERRIGRNGYASIYQGTLQRKSVAVKLFRSNHIDDRGFLNEFRTTMFAQHKNIVRYLGYCCHKETEALKLEGKFVMYGVPKRLICFEYLSNGSLLDHLSDVSCGLEWRARYEVIKGICEGIFYLHEKRIVHLDLKPANILLDDNMVPKIANFFLSRCFDADQSQAIATNKIDEACGYMAPEFMDSGVISFKSDIYSIGVIMTEIMTGSKENFAAEKVLESWRTRLGTSSTDTLLEQVRVCADISMACRDIDTAKRPDIQGIVQMLVETEH